MIVSIKRFLFLYLLLSTICVSSLGIIGNYFIIKYNLQYQQKVLSSNTKQIKIHRHLRQSYNEKSKAYLQKMLIRNIVIHYIIVSLITCLILGLLIWIIIGHGLRKLYILAENLQHRSGTDFTPINTKNLPIEIKPIINGLNNLLSHVKTAFERNKRFAADAAHELRTPLAALKTQAQVALLASTIKDSKSAIQKVLYGTDRCTHIVQQLLTLSRLGKESNLQNMKTLDLTLVTKDILTQLVPYAIEKNIDISLIEPKKRIKIKGNETTIGILIRNLVDNAIRYTPNNGYVAVTIFNNTKNVILRVADSGPGIPVELHSQVFERFYRILGTKTSGSGLGLPIVKQIAKLHKATIKLSAPKKGMGLIIDVLFPFACNV
jgi:two-component system sensor histidine kinase QseC